MSDLDLSIDPAEALVAEWQMKCFLSVEPLIPIDSGKMIVDTPAAKNTPAREQDDIEISGVGEYQTVYIDTSYCIETDPCRYGVRYASGATDELTSAEIKKLFVERGHPVHEYFACR